MSLRSCFESHTKFRFATSYDPKLSWKSTVTAPSIMFGVVTDGSYEHDLQCWKWFFFIHGTYVLSNVPFGRTFDKLDHTKFLDWQHFEKDHSSCAGEMFGHNVKLAGHFQNLVRQCPMTECCFQHWFIINRGKRRAWQFRSYFRDCLSSAHHYDDQVKFIVKTPFFERVLF